MYPAYYPHHTNPIHHATSNDPRAKEIDRGTLNLPYHPFPYASNHCYPIPQPCHPCCNHSYFGGPYTFTSPYPHYPPPPPPPYPTHGFYPPFPGAHPGYSFPPPHYSIEQPRYDYDKNTPTPHHCSSCEKKSNIGQEESKVDKKTTTDSLVPFLKDYPYPIVWVPPNYMNTEPNTKEKDNHPRVHVSKPLEQTLKQRGNDEIAQGQQGEVDKRFPFPIFWLPSNEVKKDIKGDNVDEKTRNDSEVESEKTSIKHGVQKVIPVKQLEAKEEKKTEKDKEKKVTEKASKLPPVCLRIDPLPKKKNTSRSPSPPGEKERSKRSTIEDSKSFKQQTELPESVKNDEKKAEKDSVVDSCSEKGVERDRLSEVEGLKVEKKKRSLSENEAGLIIQSVYRGFEVRKSQPLMKLRKIAEVGKQVVELRNRIQDLELSSSAINDKQKLIIGEIIMSLLLKLDTIQGLHPIVRDIRKSVAKELVGLQEKLDSLTSVKPETTSEETTCSTDRVEDDAIHDESQPKSDSNIAKHVENRQVEATESTQYDDYDAQVELQNEENINDNQIPTLVEPEQTADDSIGHEKAQSDSNDGSVRLDLENHEFEATDPMKTEQLITGEVNEEQVQVAVETDQRPETSEQPQSESGTSFEAMESDQTQTLTFKNMDSVEDLTTATAETMESGKEDETIQVQEPVVSAEEAPAVSDVDLTTATAETKELGEEDEAIGVQKPDVSTEEAPTVEVDDLTTATVEVEKDVSAAEATELRKEDEAIGVKDESIVAKEAAPVVDEDGGGSMEEVGGDRRLMDENEKLRAAVEELMKAGNEQVSVIKELTGRVKDLEKKLSKKKTRKLKKCRGSRASVVEEELRSCVV